MSNADTNVAAALTSAQDRKATRTSKPQAGKNLPGARRTTQAAQAPRQVITFETAQRLCPTEGQINRIVQVYGLDAVDYHAIREASEQAIGTVARAMTSYMNETAMRMHLQRIVGAHIGSAFGAGQFYDTKAEQARNLTSAIANEDRDEDRMGVDGGANRAARARTSPPPLPCRLMPCSPPPRVQRTLTPRSWARIGSPTSASSRAARPSTAAPPPPSSPPSTASNKPAGGAG